MKLTRILAVVLALLMVLTLAVACANKEPEKPTEEQKQSSSSESVSSSEQKDPDPEVPYELVYDSDFNLNAGESKEIVIDKTKIDTTSPIVITFNFAQDKQVSGGLDDNAIMSINGVRALRCTSGYATSILNPTTIWSSTAGSDGWWGYKGDNFAIDPETGYCKSGPYFECEIDVANGTCDFKACWKGNKDEETGEQIYNLKGTFDNTVVDFSGDTVTLKFGGTNTPALSITDLTIDCVIK